MEDLSVGEVSRTYEVEREIKTLGGFCSAQEFQKGSKVEGEWMPYSQDSARDQALGGEKQNCCTEEVLL